MNIVTDSLGQPFAADPHGPVFDAARKAYHEAYGRASVDIGVGGSIPFIAEFARAFPTATILVTSPGADASSRTHQRKPQPQPQRLRARLPGRGSPPC